MQFPTPAIDAKQEQSLAWAQEANLSWTPGDNQARPLSDSEIMAIKASAGLDASNLFPGVLVVDTTQPNSSKLWTVDAFDAAREAKEFQAGMWAWDAKSASWRQLSSSIAEAPEPLQASEVIDKQMPPQKIENAEIENVPQSTAQKNIESDSPVNEINVFKDEKQHIFYSMKHLKLRIEQGAFSMADWGWDDDTDDWIPLSELLPKISSKFVEEESSDGPVDNQKWLERVEKLEVENARLSSERDKLKSAANVTANATLEKQDLQTELEQLQRQLEDSQRREARARRDFEQEMDRLKDTHQAEVDSLQQKIYSLEKNGDELRENLASSEKTALEKSDNLKSSQMTRKQQESRIDELSDEVEELKKTNKTLQSDLNLEKKTHEERAESEARLMNKVDELQEKLRERKQRVESLESEIIDRNHDRELMAAELREQMDKIAIVSSNLDKVAGRLDR